MSFNNDQKQQPSFCAKQYNVVIEWFPGFEREKKIYLGDGFIIYFFKNVKYYIALIGNLIYWDVIMRVEEYDHLIQYDTKHKESSAYMVNRNTLFFQNNFFEGTFFLLFPNNRWNSLYCPYSYHTKYNILKENIFIRH